MTHKLGAVLAMLVALACGCGGGTSATGGNGRASDSGGEIEGLVVKGPVAATTVTAYELDPTMTRGAQLASATAGADGSFTLNIPSYNGAIEVVATGGTYVEEALGTSVSMTDSLSFVIGSYTAGTKATVTVTPVSTIAEGFARFHVAKGETVAAAVDEAFTHLNAHFGGIDWRTVSPTCLTSPTVTSLTQPAVAGAVLAAFSQEAMVLARRGGQTPGVSVTGAALAQAGSQNASADGTLDGYGPSGSQMSLAGVPLDGQTFRRTFAQAMVLFMENTAVNKSALKMADVNSLATSIAANADTYLFCQGGVSTAACQPGAIDLDPPAVAFNSPVAGSGVHGTVTISVTATDASQIKTLEFTAPAGITAPQAAIVSTTGQSGSTGTLTGTLNVSALSGPLQISVYAEDQYDNAQTYTLDVVVDNIGPAITVTSPLDTSTTVNGMVTISANAVAQAQGATVASLALSPCPLTGSTCGFGSNTAVAAGQLSISWDTTKVPEGPFTLTFQATDSLGRSSLFSMTVTVHNVPYGVITVNVTAGAPIAGAFVNIYAVNQDGSIDASSGTSGLLGTGGPTDASGTSVITLTAENYSGPIRVEASGSSLSYTDPTDGKTIVGMPTAFTLSSFVASYTTGATATVPMTLWTTLADAEDLAYMQGLHRSHPGTHTLSQAMAARDVLFQSHVVTNPGAWNLRSSVPVMLASAQPQTLRDVVYAELFDIGLNEEARDIAAQAGYSGTQVINAIYLANLLLQDVEADGVFDGLGQGALQLQTSGQTPVPLDANTLRVKLANGLDEFIFSSENTSGLTRSDLMNAGVYDTIATDVSDLFGSETPQPFDISPPIVNVSATFTNGSFTNPTTPVGNANAVGGTVTLTVTATDPVGVQSLSVTGPGGVTVPGNVLSASNGLSAQFLGSFNTTTVPDGLQTFTVMATDLRHNSGKTTYTLTVDNTAPTITQPSPAQPAAGQWFSSMAGNANSTVTFNFSATDTNGVASLVLGGVPGFVNHGAPGTVYGPWTIPSTTPDGPFAYTVKGCDVVGNCTTASYSFNVDGIAPMVSWAGTAPAEYTNVAATTIKVTASQLSADAGCGIAGVFVQVGGQIHPATLWGGTWSWTGALSLGWNLITVWAVDNVGNSGQNSTGYYQQTSVLFDTILPSVSVDQSFASYSPEEGMTVGTSGALATVPPVYSYTSSPSVVASGSIVYKAATRLGWASPPSDLEGVNALNIPTVRFVVSNYNPALTAPIASAAYSVAVSCSGCSYAPITGQLWVSSLTSPTVEAFLLPLSSNIIPALSSLQGPATLGITLTLTDTAGNISVLGPFTVTFHVIGAPVAIMQDASYGEEGDPTSTYYYTIAGKNYWALFDVTTVDFASAANQVRIVKYRISNPGAMPVGVSFNLAGGAWAMAETWTQGWGPETSGQEPRWVEGTCANGSLAESACELAYEASGYSDIQLVDLLCLPYGGCFLGAVNYGSTNDPSKAQCRSSATPLLPAIGTVTGLTTASGTPVLGAYAPVVGQLYDSVIASTTGQGDFIVPPATEIGPGVLDVYVGRPVAAGTREATGYSLNSYDTCPVGTTSEWQAYEPDGECYYVVEDYVWQPVINPPAYPPLASTCGVPSYEEPFAPTWTSYMLAEYLSASSETVSGSLATSTRGITSGNASFGEYSNMSAVPVAASASH